MALYVTSNLGLTYADQGELLWHAWMNDNLNLLDFGFAYPLELDELTRIVSINPAALPAVEWDERHFTATISNDETEDTVVWEGGAADLGGADYEVRGCVLEKSAGAPWTGYGVKPLSKTVSGFTIETDAPPGTGESYKFTGFVRRPAGL